MYFYPSSVVQVIELYYNEHFTYNNVARNSSRKRKHRKKIADWGLPANSESILPTRIEKKITDSEYFQIYPWIPISPQLYWTVKVHEAERNYIKRTIFPIIGTPYRIPKYLVKTIKATPNKNNHNVQNFSSFVCEVFICMRNSYKVQCYQPIASDPQDKSFKNITKSL